MQLFIYPKKDIISIFNGYSFHPLVIFISRSLVDPETRTSFDCSPAHALVLLFLSSLYMMVGILDR